MGKELKVSIPNSNLNFLEFFQKSYDKYIIAFSGGKDSLACLLYLLFIGIPKEKIELWHHDIDGHDETFFDWEVTPAYCKAVADHFGIPIYFSWKEGGMLGEIMRKDSPTKRSFFQTPEGLSYAGGKGPNGTRLKFPQVAANLSVRWCSAYLKIDICSTAIRNQKRFNNSRTLLISGERGEESTNRSNYFEFESDHSDKSKGLNKRHVDRWRPIKNWLEIDVWEIIEQFKIRVHPAYYMGWGRVSCKWCIFGNADQMASAYHLSKKQGDRIINLEKEFGVTIKRNISLIDLIEKGKPYETITPTLADLAIGYEYSLSIEMKTWTLPEGAYGNNCGPT